MIESRAAESSIAVILSKLLPLDCGGILNRFCANVHDVNIIKSDKVFSGILILHSLFFVILFYPYFVMGCKKLDLLMNLD
jgi:hypothetical protein